METIISSLEVKHSLCQKGHMFNFRPSQTEDLKTGDWSSCMLCSTYKWYSIWTQHSFGHCQIINVAGCGIINVPASDFSVGQMIYSYTCIIYWFNNLFFHNWTVQQFIFIPLRQCSPQLYTRARDQVRFNVFFFFF